jgi:hypothetical protein
VTEPIGKPFLVGSLVSYYLEGWRAGYLDSMTSHTGSIRPIVAKGAAIPRCVRVPLDDIRAT